MKLYQKVGVVLCAAAVSPLLAVAAPSTQSVLDRLVSLGLSPDQAQVRVAQMNDAELGQFVAQPSLLQVGGTIQGDETDTSGPVGHGKRTVGSVMDYIYENLLGWDRTSSKWDARYWTMSAGAVWSHETLQMNGFGVSKHQNRLGGFLAAEYYPTQAFSIEPSVSVVDAANLNWTTVTSNDVHFGAVSVSLGVDGKLHLFKLTGLKDCPLQPYLLAGVRGVFYDSDASVDGVSTGKSPLSSLAAYRVGGGVDLKLGKKWFGRADASWSSVINAGDADIPGVGVSGFKTEGWLISAGLGRRF